MKKTILLGLILTLAVQTFAWDAVGHRIVAEIAYQNLTKKARKQVDEVLGKRGIVYYASWPDEIKSDTIYPESHVWHYQNLDAGKSRADLDSLFMNKTLEGRHLFFAKDSLENVLKNDRKQADALKFLVHFAGDEFQPMHMGHSTDAGANKISMTWWGQKTNLHSVWDGKLIASQQMNYSEYAQFLIDRYAPQKKEVWNMTELECLYKTYDAVNYIYDYTLALGDQKRYEYRYVYVMKDIMNYQLYAAGIQLAKLLNEIYK